MRKNLFLSPLCYHRIKLSSQMDAGAFGACCWLPRWSLAPGHCLQASRVLGSWEQAPVAVRPAPRREAVRAASVTAIVKLL